MAADNDHTGGARDQPFGLDDDYVYESTKLKNAEEYKQQRRLQAILDARDGVLEQRDTAYEFWWENRIGHDDFLKAVRVAVQKYLLQSEWAIRNHKYSQWYWEGVPPTVDGGKPFTSDGRLRAVMPGQSLTHPKTGETAPFEEIIDDESDFKNPVLVTEGGDSWSRLGADDFDPGTPPFGKKPNVLGELPMTEVGRSLTFIGLESFMEVGDPIRRTTEVESDHPQKIRETKPQTYEYQIPEDVSLAAYRLINQFWEHHGMSLDIDRGQSVIRNFDMSDEPEYRHTDGSPPV